MIAQPCKQDFLFSIDSKAMFSIKISEKIFVSLFRLDFLLFMYAKNNYSSITNLLSNKWFFIKIKGNFKENSKHHILISYYTMYVHNTVILDIFLLNGIFK